MMDVKRVDLQRRHERRRMGRSAAIAASGPTTALVAPLGGAVAAATRSAPGEDREGRQATEEIKRSVQKGRDQ